MITFRLNINIGRMPFLIYKLFNILWVQLIDNFNWSAFKLLILIVIIPSSLNILSLTQILECYTIIYASLGYLRFSFRIIFLGLSVYTACLLLIHFLIQILILFIFQGAFSFFCTFLKLLNLTVFNLRILLFIRKTLSLQ